MNNQNNLYSDNRIETSMLRSALLFNSHKTSGGKRDMLLKSILSIIIEGNGKYTPSILYSIFRERFSSPIEDNDIENCLKELIREKIVDKENETGKLYVKDGETGSAFFKNIEIKTENLITVIVSKAEKLLSSSINRKEKAIDNVKKALTMYYRMYGYSLNKIELQEKPQEQALKNSIDIATDGFDKRTGDALIIAIADTLQFPTSEESDILYLWARAYISMHVMNIDPALRNFRAGILGKKTFVLDTDVVLNCIAKNAKYSHDYKMMIDKLTEIGCTIIIPQEIIQEVSDHFDAAKKQYQFEGDRLLEIPEENLESIGSNVFIEDWVKTVRYENKPDFTFWVYFDNMYNPQDPSYLNDTLEKTFGEKNMKNEIKAMVDPDTLNKLFEKIQSRTLQTPKAINRSDEKNEEISETDAFLYLAITEMNKDTNGKALLNRNAYLLTSSKRAIKSAREIGIYEKNVICEPKVMLAVLQEMGTIQPNSERIFNLFDNPFLAYTANLIWDKVEPLLQSGANLKYRDYRWLRKHYETNFDKLLASETYDEKVTEAKRLTNEGFLFTKEMVEANKSREQSDEENKKLKKELEEARRMLEESEQKRKKAEYEKKQLEKKGGAVSKNTNTKKELIEKIKKR